MSTKRATIGQVLRGTGFVAIAAVIAWYGWNRGRGDALGDPATPSDPDLASVEAAETNPTTSFRVASSSMIPSLRGPALAVGCQRCQRVSWVDHALVTTPTRHRVCVLCGGRLSTSLGHSSIPAEATKGDTVEVLALNDAQIRQLRIGTVVAYRVDGVPRVKRIAGRPGDEISLGNRRLYVNGDRIEDVIADSNASDSLGWSRLLVDDDVYQQASRWSAAAPDSTWRRDDQRRWYFRAGTTGALAEDWLRFHYTSARDSNRSSPILDDYPFNVGVTRSLSEVDRLAVRMSVSATRDVAIEVVFWMPDRIGLARREVAGSQTRKSEIELSCYDAVDVSGSPVTKQNPIAMRVVGGDVEVSSLTVERFVEYRVRKDDPRQQYPMFLAQNEFFLLGDNVPVSDDGRVSGPTPIHDLIGRVTNANTIMRKHVAESDRRRAVYVDARLGKTEVVDRE
ncbi:MAG: hypothetical protein HKN47_21450 [Pirellulaceae bacterium]|nr:hypothetical protein [Pirellulaceae bacterium]